MESDIENGSRNGPTRLDSSGGSLGLAHGQSRCNCRVTLWRSLLWPRRLFEGHGKPVRLPCAPGISVEGCAPAPLNLLNDDQRGTGYGAFADRSASLRPKLF